MLIHPSFAVVRTVGGGMTLSHMVNNLKMETLAAIVLLSEAITEAGFGKHGADWQANDVSWMSHYTPSLLHTNTHSVVPSPREILICT